jgi:hypothetical protein
MGILEADLDSEWIVLIIEALEIGLSMEEISSFLNSN